MACLERVREGRLAVGTPREVRERVAPGLLFGQRLRRAEVARRCRQPELVRRAEVLQHAEPVPEPRAVALVHDHEVEEVRLEVLEQLPPTDLLEERLVVRIEHLPDPVLVRRNDLLIDDDAVGLGVRRERSVGLALEAVAVRQEEHAVVRQDAGSDQHPGELEDGERLARARRHEQEDPAVAPREPGDGLLDGAALVGPQLLLRHLVHVRSHLQHPPPSVGQGRALREGQELAGEGGAGRSSNSPVAVSRTT